MFKGFKCHTQTEGHVRNMQLVAEDSRKFISQYSTQFQNDFLRLLKTSHGEKKVHVNHFYQEYISEKSHVHMNATKWSSLTEFATHLGREGLCRVEETDKGLHVAWIDNSPDALRRQDAIRKKERQDKGDEQREQRQIQEQIERAQEMAKSEANEADRALKRTDEDKKIQLSFSTPKIALTKKSPDVEEKKPEAEGVKSKPKNVFASAAKKRKQPPAQEAPKKMSAAERIMKEEMERKRMRVS